MLEDQNVVYNLSYVDVQLNNEAAMVADTKAEYSSVFLANGDNQKFDKSVSAKYIIEKNENVIQTVLVVECPTGFVKNISGICVD